MNIGFYIPVLNTGGAEKVIINLLKQLASHKDPDQYFLITDAEHSLWIAHIDERVKIIHVNSHASFLGRLKGLSKAIKLNNIDTVVSHLTHSNIHCLLLKLVIKINLIIVEHSITSFYIKSLGALPFHFKKLLIKLLYNISEKIVCVSHATRKDLVENFGVNNLKCGVIYNPVDFESIKKLSKENLSVEIERKIGSKKIFVTVGRLEKIKNHSFLIDSLKYFVKENDLFLIIVGGGSEEEVLSRQIIENSLSENVLITGNEDNPYKYISKSCGLIHPSKFEGFGLVLIEALYLCKPVISLNFQAANEVLDNGRLGQIAYDEQSLLDALQGLMEGSGKSVELEGFASEVSLKYNLKIIADQYRRVFKELIHITK